METGIGMVRICFCRALPGIIRHMVADIRNRIRNLIVVWMKCSTWVVDKSGLIVQAYDTYACDAGILVKILAQCFGVADYFFIDSGRVVPM